MDPAAAVAIQQATLQGNIGMAMVKQQAQAEQSIVNMIAQSTPTGSRGQNLNITA